MSNKKPNLPTDCQILECIYNTYYEDFISFRVGKRPAKNYVSVDFDLIGQKLGVEGDIPFGRIYYFLSPKYSYRDGDSEARLIDRSFEPDMHGNRNWVQFVLLA